MADLRAIEEAVKQFRSRDWRRVRGAYGQTSLWPDPYLDEGFSRRDEIRQFPQFFCQEPQSDGPEPKSGP